MIKMRRSGSGALLAMLALASCGRPAPPARAVYRDPGAPVRAAVGTEFVLEIPYNPTVAPGYRLELRSPLPEFLLDLGVDPSLDPPEDRKPGSGGTRLHRFRAVRSGSGSIVFSPGIREDAPGRPEPLTFSVTVTGP